MPESDPSQRPRVELFSELSRLPVWSKVRSATKGVSCQVVGGTLRDLALGLMPEDLDITVEHGGEIIWQRLAASLPATAIRLGGDRFAAFRLACAEGTIDIWDREGADLTHDLARRDFTLHSFAVDIESGKLTDPFGGVRDLESRRLVATSKISFTEDPLRALRLCRFLAQIDRSRADQSTLSLAKESVPCLDKVAIERLRHELDMLIALPDAWTGVATMISLGIYPRIFLPGQDPGNRSAPVSTDRLEKSFRVADRLATGLSMPIKLSLVRLGLLVTGLPQVISMSDGKFKGVWWDRSPIARKTARELARILNGPGIPIEPSEQRWFLNRHGHLWSSALCLVASQQGASALSDPLAGSIREISRLAADLGEAIFSPRFVISGVDLQEILGLLPGKELGEILKVVQRRQIEGKITTRSEAIDLARRLMDESNRRQL